MRTGVAEKERDPAEDPGMRKNRASLAFSHRVLSHTMTQPNNVQILLLDAAVADPVASVPQPIWLVVDLRLRRRLEVERQLIRRGGEEGGAIGDGGRRGRRRHNVVIGVNRSLSVQLMDAALGSSVGRPVPNTTLNTHSCYSHANHPVSDSSLCRKNTEKYPRDEKTAPTTISEERCAGHTQLHPPLVWSCLASSDWFSNAARKIKHSYANIIISLSSMCVGGGDGKTEHLDIFISNNQCPPVGGGGRELREDESRACALNSEITADFRVFIFADTSVAAADRFDQ
ncbi:hypothetical protein EYF80_019006 [Liparis tanakae]|uniref:Uncharacterized protein n=1 Tax=Liparis tanakae TaxID=230148 RepID=A0A4Z2I0G3_9TELE|nr:hypothetical protein EYF80_019006 [Liparis tanakae]